MLAGKQLKTEFYKNYAMRCCSNSLGTLTNFDQYLELVLDLVCYHVS